MYLLKVEYAVYVTLIPPTFQRTPDTIPDIDGKRAQLLVFLGDGVLLWAE